MNRKITQRRIQKLEINLAVEKRKSTRNFQAGFLFGWLSMMFFVATIEYVLRVFFGEI